MFVNPEVPIDSLPAAQRVEWQPLDPAYLPRLLVGRAILWLTIVCGAGVAQVLAIRFEPSWASHWELIAPAWALLGLAAVRSLVWPFLSVPRQGYALRDKDILYKVGVLWRSSHVVPFNRVQHAVTSNAPLDRRFGLASLTVFTAGGGLGDMVIAGLRAEVAERLCAHIVGKLRRAAEAESVADD